MKKKNELRKKVIITLLFLLFIGFYSLVVVHEAVHVQINKSHGAESKVYYAIPFTEDRIAYTVRTEPCKYYCEEMFLAHNLNEVFGYTIITLYVIFILVLIVFSMIFIKEDQVV